MAVTSLASLRSLQLCGVHFVNQEPFQGQICEYVTNNPRNFLLGLRDEVGWRSRPLQPKVTVVLYHPLLAAYQMVKVDSEVNEFLYENGENPFAPAKFEVRSSVRVDIKHGDLHQMCSGKGTRLDEFDPAHERPNVDEETLKQLGFISADESSGYKSMRDGPWGDGPWGPHTCPTLKEQGLDEPISSSRD
jgi:hypothetical protein